jgi:type VI secretion system secreted protein VgrG
MKPLQQHRQVAITTALGPDALVLNRFTVHERMNAPFDLQAELAAVDGSVDYNKIVGNKATIRLELGAKGTRYFNGYISRFVQTPACGGYARYQATIVPWLWLLARTADCRVFQRKSVPDIAEEVFGKDLFGSEFYELRTSDSYPARRYCVQYRETDFHFVNRLLEAEGIYYWFEHKDGKHKLVLADGIGGSQPAPGYESLDFIEAQQGAKATRDAVTQWVMERQVEPVSYMLKDYDFKKPAQPLEANHDVSRQHGMARFAVYDFPGDYFEPDQAQRLARLRLEELQARHDLLQGATSARGLAAGAVFELHKHPRADQNRKYLITDLTLSVDAGEFASGGGGDEFFNCHFTAIPSNTQYRPPRLTPKPLIQGIQTATVVGPAGEEIHTDKYGRVKVQFHWDRYGKSDENSSCWVRVAQALAGKKWGAICIPRMGQEVVVEFLEGDPDRPLITGSVYNDEQQVPYGLPAEKTKSAIKSNSSLGGLGFNEIRFEDSKGKEQVFIHAERNLDLRVKNDEMERVIGNRHLIAGWEKDGAKGGDQREMVYQDKHLKVHRNQVEHIGGDIQLLVGGVDAGQGNQDIVLKGAKKESIGQDNHLHVKGDRNEQIDGDQSLTISGKQQEKVGTNHALEAGQEIHLKAGMKVILEAGLQLTIKAAGGFVDIGPSGVTIQGNMVLINSGGSAGSGSGSSPTAPDDPQEAMPLEPAKADDAKSGQKSAGS